MKNQCEKNCLEHRYHCVKCWFPLTFSPANYASRPQDIINPCETCENCFKEFYKPPEECKHENWFVSKSTRKGTRRFCKFCGIEIEKEELKPTLPQPPQGVSEEFESVFGDYLNDDWANRTLLEKQRYVEEFLSSQRSELLKVVEEMKKEDAEFSSEDELEADSSKAIRIGFNQAIEDITKKIK